ncbi:MAG: hypothetical protein M1820_009149 [Bogoriella megaspora]|nr:MAG: hypothetical protein M1820_009149 [Bogoriella megaspora]
MAEVRKKRKSSSNNAKAVNFQYKLNAAMPTAEYDRTSKKYILTPEIRADQPFMAVKNTILPGDKLVVTFQPAPTFPFMKLPAEIRLMIYELILESPNVARFTSVSGKVKIPYAVYRRTMGILRVNKQISAEALPVLYGAPRIFEFLGHMTAVSVLNKLKVNHQYLSSINLDRFCLLKAETSLFWNRIRSCTNLRCLRLDIIACCGPPDNRGSDLGTRMGNWMFDFAKFRRFLLLFGKESKLVPKERYPGLDVVKVRPFRRTYLDGQLEINFRNELRKLLEELRMNPEMKVNRVPSGVHAKPHASY